jgi:hypothetical protein
LSLIRLLKYHFFNYSADKSVAEIWNLAFLNLGRIRFCHGANFGCSFGCYKLTTVYWMEPPELGAQGPKICFCIE